MSDDSDDGPVRAVARGEGNERDACVDEPPVVLDPHPGERVWFSAPPALPALRILHAHPSSRLWKVWHETYTVCLCHDVRDPETNRSGVAHWSYRSAQLTTVKGGVMLMEPGECHVTQKIVGLGTFDVLQIDPEYVAELSGETALHLRTASANDPALAHAVNGLLDAVQRSGDQLEQELALQRVVGLLARNHGERSRSVPGLNKVQLRRAIDYIVEHHASDFGVAELAHGSGASVSGVCHGLKEAVGVTPMELRNLVRIARAQGLLARGARPIDVSAAVGFCDQAALTRHFKKAWAVTPKEYARSVQRRHTLRAWPP